MQARIILADVAVNPRSGLAFDPERMIEQKVQRGPMTKIVHIWKQGAIIDRPDAYRLVQLGVAEPADEECEQAASMTRAQMKEAQFAQASLAAFIEVRHKELYRRGLIAGYDYPHNLFVLGPNAAEAEQFRSLFSPEDWEKFQRSIEAATDDHFDESDSFESALSADNSTELSGSELDSPNSGDAISPADSGENPAADAGGTPQAAPQALQRIRGPLPGGVTPGADPLPDGA